MRIPKIEQRLQTVGDLMRPTLIRYESEREVEKSKSDPNEFASIHDYQLPDQMELPDGRIV